MPGKTKQNNKLERIIYLLLGPNCKKFFVGYCVKERLRETYQKNLLGIRKGSADFIKEVGPNRPCAFELETVIDSKDKLINYLIAWIRLLADEGYICCNNESLVEMANSLYGHTQILYEERKSVNIKELLACVNCAIPNFNRETCENYPLEIVRVERKKAKRAKEIRLMVSDEEYEAIAAKARMANMQVSPYIRMASQCATIIRYNYEIIEEHTKRLTEIRNEISRLVYTIDVLNNYLPRDIERIVNLINDIELSENELLKTLREMRNKDIPPVVTGEFSCEDSDESL